jgi:glycosyltransferase involved in cell wall biosynthesis
MPDLSVILCTHNPRPDYLRRTLDSLKVQTLPTARWELLLIDNASAEPLADAWDLTWHPNARSVREDGLGLTRARLCGIRESRADLLVFVDDDNVLAPDFLEQILKIVARHPQLTVFGAGILEPEFEVPPPAELSELLFMLALRRVASPCWSNNPQDSACRPYGAGLCVHRDVAGKFVQFIERLKTSVVFGRRGKQQLFQNEDDLFSWVAVESGRGFGIFPELKITHLISAGRLTKNYFLRLIFYGTISHWILQYLLAGNQPAKISFFRIFHIALHGMRHGLFSMRCQWAWARGEDKAAHVISEKQLSPGIVRKSFAVKPD